MYDHYLTSTSQNCSYCHDYSQSSYNKSRWKQWHWDGTKDFIVKERNDLDIILFKLYSLCDGLVD